MNAPYSKTPYNKTPYSKTAYSKEIIKRVVELEGIGCASCADKIERKLLSLPGVEAAQVNFALSRLVLVVEDAVDISPVLSSAKKIFKETEPGVRLILDEAGGNGESGELERLKPAVRTAPVEETVITWKALNKWFNPTLIRMVLAGIIFLFPFVFDLSAVGFLWTGVSEIKLLKLTIPAPLEFLLFLTAYLIAGLDIICAAFRNLLKGDVFSEYFLMTIATIGAFAIGKYPEAVAVMLFYKIGEYFQDIAVDNSRRSIKALLAIKPDSAVVIRSGNSITVKSEEVKIGETIVVKPGERIPLDGVVKEGRTLVDTSALTGESMPRETAQGDEVLSGTINLDGILYIDVTKPFGESTVSRILKLVEEASEKKAPTENFITRFSRYYTPFVVSAAVLLALLPPLLVPGQSFSLWIYRALIFLVISCPCAFVVSIPLGFFGGIGRASRDGVLVKGSNYLEALTEAEIVVFDKTGTLTEGGFTVTDVVPFNGTDRDTLFRTAAIAENFSNHPIALSIVNAFIDSFGMSKSGEGLNNADVKDYRELSGLGVEADIDGRHVRAGKLRFLEQNGIAAEKSQATGTVVYVSIDNKYAGYIALSDRVKEDAAEAIEQLKSLGIKKIVMLTGDREEAAQNVGRYLHIDSVYSELLPHEKVEKVELLEREKIKGEKLAFVGDGINDAPVLARADVGIAMGGVGSEAAIEAADVVLMTDEPSAIVRGIKTARRTRRIVWQNIILALGIKGIFMLLGAAGLATLWEAVFADVGVTIIAVFNALRILKR